MTKFKKKLFMFRNQDNCFEKLIKMVLASCSDLQIKFIQESLFNLRKDRGLDCDFRFPNRLTTFKTKMRTVITFLIK